MLRSLRGQLVALFLAFALGPAALLGGVAIMYALDSVRANITSRNQQLAEALAGEVGRFLEAQVVHLQGLGAASGLAFDAHAAAHLSANPAIRTLLLLDSQGRVANVAPFDRDLHGIDLSAQPVVREARERGEPTWSSATISPQSGQPQVTLAVPARGRMVVGYLDLESLRGIVERLRAEHGDEAVVIDRDGTVIASRETRLVREQVNLRDLAPVRAGLAGRGSTAEFSFQGSVVLGSASRVAHANWVVLVTEPLAEAYAPVYRTQWLMLALLGGVVLLAVLAGLLSARRILGPVDALALATRRMAAGELPAAPVGAAGHDFLELEDLARSFDAMVAAVRQREEALASSERSYRRLVSTPAASVLRTTLTGEMLFANETFLQTIACPSSDELLKHLAGDFYKNPADRERMLKLVRTEGRAANLEVVFRTLDGRDRDMLLNVVRDEGETLTTVGVDVTEMKRAAADRDRLEEQLRHSQKVEAVGRLAGGIAHDFNNLLTAIVSLADLLGSSFQPGSEERGHADGILEAAERASRLTRSLLAFSRKQILERWPVDLREVIGRVETLLRRLIGEDVDFRVTLPGEALFALLDTGQVEQVLVNLCTNARDAMPRGGTLAISCDQVSLTDGEAQAEGLARGGPFVRCSVRDTGEGMTPEVRARIFEPFFTTKGPGRGTGLGLAVVHGIVHQHGGALRVESAPGVGSTFHVLLPAEVGDAPKKVPSGPRPALGPGGTETILLAEDEDLVRRVLRSVLVRAGYQVIEAANGRVAVDQFAAGRGTIALCLLDVMMPVLNGRQALEEILRLDPKAKVLLSSGYTADVLETRGVGDIRAELIPKPMAPGDLLRKVRETLDRPASAPR